MLQTLFDNEVRFLVVGAYALGAYGYPRATGREKDRLCEIGGLPIFM